MHLNGGGCIFIYSEKAFKMVVVTYLLIVRMHSNGGGNILIMSVGCDY